MFGLNNDFDCCSAAAADDNVLWVVSCLSSYSWNRVPADVIGLLIHRSFCCFLCLVVYANFCSYWLEHPQLFEAPRPKSGAI
jgi:hypothetical protein